MSGFLQKLRASFRTRAWRAGAYSVFAAVIVIAIGVVANLAVNALPASVTQLDMTTGGLYTISQGTEQMAAALDEDVDIYWLVQDGYENHTIEQVLLRYAEFDHIDVTKVDPVRYPGFAAQYTDQSVTENSVLVVSGERSMYIPYDSMWTYSDYETYSYYMTYYDTEYLDVFTGEGKVTSAIQYVTGDELPVLYYLTGHGETGPGHGGSRAGGLRRLGHIRPGERPVRPGAGDGGGLPGRRGPAAAHHRLRGGKAAQLLRAAG